MIFYIGYTASIETKHGCIMLASNKLKTTKSEFINIFDSTFTHDEIQKVIKAKPTDKKHVLLKEYGKMVLEIYKLDESKDLQIKISDNENQNN